MNGGHERFVGVFQTFQTRVHHLRAFDGLLARLQLLEHVDVRTGDERRVRADQDDRVRGRIVAGARDGLADTLGNAGAQGIHRWVVDGDDGNAVATWYRTSGDMARKGISRTTSFQSSLELTTRVAPGGAAPPAAQAPHA